MDISLLTVVSFFMSGDFVRVKVTGSNDYDLIGEVYDESAE